MQSKFKVYNFEFGTIKNQREEIRIEMESTQFDIDSVEEIRQLYKFDRPEVLPLKDIKESDTSYTLVFEKTGEIKNLIDIKKEEYPVKIAIAQRILEQDILHQYEEDLYFSLNPSTIYYYPMQTVKYTYVANHNMPKGINTNLERYRACVVSILSGIAYEKCLNSPEDVKKQGNELIKEIYNQNSRAELLAFIRQSNNFMTYDYIGRRIAEKNKIKNRYRMAIGAIGVLAIAGAGLLVSQLHKQENNISQAYEMQLSERDSLIEANEAFHAEEYERAISLYENANYDPELLAERLIEEEEYQLAFNVNESSLENIIQTLYDRDQKEHLLTLEAPEGISEETARKLSNEKVVMDGDNSQRLNVLNFLNDENTAERLAMVYIEENDLASAGQIQEQYPENESIAEAVEQAELMQQRSEIESSIKGLEEELEGVGDGDEDQEQRNNIQDTINELRSELEGLPEVETDQEESSD